MRIERRLRFILIGLGCFLLISHALEAAGRWRQAIKLNKQPISVMVDGKIRSGVKVVLFGDTFYVSLRDMARIYSGRCRLYRVSREAGFELFNRQIRFFWESSTVKVGGKMVALSSPVREVNGRVYVPVSFLATDTFSKFSESSTTWEALAYHLAVKFYPGLSSPRLASYPDKSRVVIELGSHVGWRLMEERPDSLTIQFFGGRSSTDEKIRVQEGFIKKISLANRRRSAVLKLFCSPEAGPPEIDFRLDPRSLIVEVPKASAEYLAEKKVATGRRKMFLAGLSKNLCFGKIVIDPGHGGKDPGALGPKGTKEKDVNLILAKSLAKVLKKDGRHVVLTRADDTFIPLVRRTQIANKEGADLFVSIHCNASFQRDSEGFEVYFLSEEATDPGAAAVARLENAVINLEGTPSRKREKLQRLLWSMAKNEFMNESSEICALVSQQVNRKVKVENRGVKQANFFVLRGTQMPAILIEAAFISNRKEEAKLRKRRFQKKVVNAIYHGFLSYEKMKR